MESQKKGRRRLEPEAYTILNDYFVNVSKWPDPAAQEHLAERVRHVKGCEFYTARQVYSYFANNRAKIRTVGSDAALPTGVRDSPTRGRRKSSQGHRGPGSSRARPLSDSAPDSIIRKLDVLLDDDPDPSPEVVEVWADSLGDGVVAEHILTYAFLRRATTCREADTQTRPQPPEHQVEGSAARLPLASPSLGSPSAVPLNASTHPSPLHCNANPPHDETTEHRAPSVPVPPLPAPPQPQLPQPPTPTPGPASTSQVAPAPADPRVEPDALVPVRRKRNESAVGRRPVSASAPPLAPTVRSDDLVQRVRAALVEADARGTRDSPKTFVDFARWLEAHN